MIEEYKFGQITIDGQTYQQDIQTDWQGEVLNWILTDENIIGPEDVRPAVEKNPQSLVIGLGYEAGLKLADEARALIQEKNIELFVDRTEEAVRTFNILKEESLEEEGTQEKVVGLFHLTS